IAALDTGLGCRPAGHDHPGLNAAGSLDPGGAVIRWNIAPLLLSVETTQYENGDGQQDRRNIPKGKDLSPHVFADQQPMFQKTIQITLSLTLSGKTGL